MAIAAIAGCCSLIVIPLLAVFVATGLVKVFYAAGKFVPAYVPTAGDKALTVPNGQMREFLQKAGLKGGAEPRGPLNGVYMLLGSRYDISYGFVLPHPDMT